MNESGRTGEGMTTSFPRTLVVLLAAVLFILALSGAGQNPTERDYSTTRLSEKGMYKVSFQAAADPIPVNKVHSWRLHVEDPAGHPVPDASIAVDGGMPEHGHGLPTKPQVTQNLGNGDYIAEGMKFQMRGWWVVRFAITSGDTTDTVTFNLQL
jgi:hypothetical protein